MGTVYYLARPDNCTLFDLGKSYGAADAWIKAWELAHVQHWLHPLVVETSVMALAKVLRLGMGFHADTSYLCEVIRRILRFADGHEVQLVDDEHQLDEYRDDDGGLRVAGSRFND
jgi:hypothetical protein